MNLKNLFLLPSLIVLSVCDPRYYEYNTGTLPEDPVNLEDFNTAWDDYNATAPTLGYLIPFCFSSNRKSQGTDFDVIYQPMNVSFSKITGILSVYNEYDNWGIYQEVYDVILTALNKINTTGNEFGPNLIPLYDNDTINFILLYASDFEGKFNIYYTENAVTDDFAEPLQVKFLNSNGNDLYPSFNSEGSRIYFCSDRENGNFDIYSAEIGGPDYDPVPELNDTLPHDIVKESVVSSEGDDKCPFVFENILVFTSNRDGGYGGYDLYYSVYRDGSWSTPQNFGPKINTEYDEYRPIIIDEGVDMDRQMMIFSSNRIGGKGGFDLYFAGITPK